VFIITGAVIALILFFVLLGFIIAKMLPKEEELTEAEEVAMEIK